MFKNLTPSRKQQIFRYCLAIPILLFVSLNVLPSYNLFSLLYRLYHFLDISLSEAEGFVPSVPHLFIIMSNKFLSETSMPTYYRRVGREVLSNSIISYTILNVKRNFNLDDIIPTTVLASSAI